MAAQMRHGMEAGTITLTGADGDEIEAYAAYPTAEVSSGGTGAVVVIHHMPGFDEATQEITRRFAARGWSAICPNLHYREAPGADPDDAAAASRAAGGVPDDRLVGDVAAAAAHLRSRPQSNGNVGVMGFCSGGRQAVLAAAALELQAAVDCYGAFVLQPPAEDFPVQVTPLHERLPEISCPVLGLFGEEDSHPAPDEVAQLDERLTEHGVPHEFHSFADAGHGFFAVDRPSYRQAAAAEGWELVRSFLATHLGGGR